MENRSQHYPAPEPPGLLRRLALIALLAGICLGRSSAPARADVLVPSFGAIPTQDATTIELAGLQEQFASLVRHTAPAVVAISASVTAVGSDDSLRSSEMSPDKLRRMLEQRRRAIGAGFSIDPAGYVATNEHVIAGREQLWVTTDDGTVYPAIVVGSDPRSDLAVLKIPATGLPVVRYAPLGSAQRGHWTIALGNPLGLAVEGQMSLSVGIISAVDRSLPDLARKEDRLYFNLIQTTAQINPGNSGGPLFNLQGEVIGINTAVILPNAITNGIGFAIPVTSRILDLLQRLKEGDEIVHGYLGVTVSAPTPRQRQAAGLTEMIGARVDAVDADSPAAAGGLSEGDIVVSFAGEPVRGSDQLVRLIGSAPVAEPLTLAIRRDARPVQVEVSLRPREIRGIAVTRERQRFRWRGLLLAPVPSNWSFTDDQHPATGVVVLGLDKDSPFAAEGVVQGTIITAIAGQAVHTIADVQRIIDQTPAEQWAIQTVLPDSPVTALSTK